MESHSAYRQKLFNLTNSLADVGGGFKTLIRQLLERLHYIVIGPLLFGVIHNFVLVRRGNACRIKIFVPGSGWLLPWCLPDSWLFSSVFGLRFWSRFLRSLPPLPLRKIIPSSSFFFSWPCRITGCFLRHQVAHRHCHFSARGDRYNLCLGAPSLCDRCDFIVVSFIR
ncbi:hypothetical protein SAMN05216315_10757 [Nitrosospira sp. Nsp18]|nr:hypothetical protein SAMN05216315_10757 [Nitrosospira sp. Nsp18]